MMGWCVLDHEQDMDRDHVFLNLLNTSKSSSNWKSSRSPNKQLKT
jgi:hypothetical protein